MHHRQNYGSEILKDDDGADGGPAISMYNKNLQANG